MFHCIYGPVYGLFFPSECGGICFGAGFVSWGMGWAWEDGYGGLGGAGCHTRGWFGESWGHLCGTEEELLQVQGTEFWNHHQTFLTTVSLQTAEHLQGTSRFYQRISAFLTSTCLPDVIWWRDELATHFQNQLCPLLPEIPSVLLSNITAVNPDPQVLYRSAWTSGNFLSGPVKVVFPLLTDILLCCSKGCKQSLKTNASNIRLFCDSVLWF